MAIRQVRELPPRSQQRKGTFVDADMREFVRVGREGGRVMESIDRLRDWLKGRLLLGNGWNELNEIADAIESEVKASRVDAYTEGYDAGFASADDWAAQHEDAMAEHGWVRLPVDADGVPIHARDMLDGYGKTIEVVEMRYGRSGWVLISRDGNAYADCAAFAHHHAPTVEDVLREFTARLIERGELTNGAAQTIAEYAARLRLAGSDAE